MIYESIKIDDSKVEDGLFEFEIEQWRKQYNISHTALSDIFVIFNDMLSRNFNSKEMIDNMSGYYFSTYNDLREYAEEEFLSEWKEDFEDEVYSEQRAFAAEEIENEKEELKLKLKEEYQRGLAAGFVLPD
jgi:Ser-tRNA(Ala) deacylase AlaX